MLSPAERQALASQAGIRRPVVAPSDEGLPAHSLRMPDLPDPSNPPLDAEQLPPSWSQEMFSQFKANKKEVGAAAAALHNKELWDRINRHRMTWNASLRKRTKLSTTSAPTAPDLGALIAAIAQAEPQERAALLAALEGEK